MKLLIDLDYQQSEKSELSNQELTYDYITHAINQKYKDGLNGNQRRTFGRIQRLFDEAISAGPHVTYINIEPDDLQFIRDAFRDAKFPPSLAKYVLVLEEELNPPVGTAEEV